MEISRYRGHRAEIVPFSKLFTKHIQDVFCVTDDKISEWVMESVAVFGMVTVGME